MKDGPAAVGNVTLRADHVRVRPEAPGAPGVVQTAGTIADYVALTKPRLNVLVVATSAAGYYMGAPGAPDIMAMAQAVIGTTLVAAGAAALNQVYERDTDAMMRRTRMRPLPDGRVACADARLFGLVLSAAGLVLLGLRANLLAALLALATLVVYLVVYTPMKRRTSLATLVGAVPGALPALIGWTASHGRVSLGGLVLFGVVFLWQIPHFMAIAWLYRDDYRNAGFPMLSVVEPNGRRSGRQAVFYAVALFPASLMPTLMGVTGGMYPGTAVVLGVGLLWLAVRFARARTDETARSLFLGSIIYLPLLWIAMIASPHVTVHDLPAINASLNTLSGVLLTIGYALIRNRRIEQHRKCMIAAFVTSSLFLICYLVYHTQVGSVRFPRHGILRPIYYTILITHVTLAVTVLPLAIVTLTRGLRGRFPQHRRIARWTLPIWLYVSVTGVLVYVLLYKPGWII